MDPQTYLSSVVYLLIGCVILGFGVYTEVLADVAMLPGESFVRAVSSTWKTEFGSTKVAFDVSLAVIAAVLSLLFAHRLDGVREGRSSPLCSSVSSPACSDADSPFSDRVSSAQMRKVVMNKLPQLRLRRYFSFR